MKKLLPKTANNPKGFTLIELMVVVAIIAILSVVAIALFANAQKQARDGKRKAEMEQIANVLEVNKISTGYIAITKDMFAGTNFPAPTSGAAQALDPSGYGYCISAATSLAGLAGDPTAVWTTPACPAAPTGWATIDGSKPVTGSNFTFYKLCAAMEIPANGTNTGTGVYCRYSQQ